MKTEYLKLALLSNLIETKFDREKHLDANWVLIDEKMKEFQESLEEYEDNVRITLTEEDLAVMAKLVELSQVELTFIAENVLLSEEELVLIGEGITDAQLKQMIESLDFSPTMLALMVAQLTDEQLQEIGSHISVTEEQLAQLVLHLSQEQLTTIGEAVVLTGEHLLTMVEHLSEAQLTEMASHVVLTEELVSLIGDNLSEQQLNHIASQVYFTEAEFKYLSTYFTEEQWQKISDGIQLSQEELDKIGSAFELSDAQMNTLLKNISIIEDDLRKMAEFLSQTQLETIGQGVELSNENLTDIALKVTFTEEQMELLKGEDGGPAEFTDEQKLLIDTCIEGLVNKQDRLTNLNPTELVTDGDDFLVIQDGATNILNAVLMAEYIISKSPIPAVGKALDDYTKSDLWAIFNYGQGQNYFQIGDRMTWMSDRVITVATIAAFNFDVKNHTTGQKANVSFVLSDTVTATSTEIPSVFDSKQSTFRAYDVSCLAPVIQLQEGASLYEAVMPEEMKGLITPSIHGRFMSGRFVTANHATDVLVTMGLFPLGLWEVYTNGATKQTDVVTGESLYPYYPLFASDASNNTYLNTYQSGAYKVLRTIDTATTASLWCVSPTTGTVAQVTTANYSSTADWIKSIAVGFCMG